MPRFKKPRLGRHQYLADCFAQGDPTLRAKCPCPPACKGLCERTRLTDHNNPRVLQVYDGLRPYTPTLNALARSWGPKVRRPRAAVKLCYLGLVSYLRPGSRWVLEHTDLLAKSLDFTTKAFTKYCGILEEEYGLTERHPMRTLSPFDRSNRNVILMCDLPEWFPGHLTIEDIKKVLGAEKLRASGLADLYDEDELEAMAEENEDEGTEEDDDLDGIDLDGLDLEGFDFDEKEDGADVDDLEPDDLDGLDLEAIDQADEEPIVAPRSKRRKVGAR